MLAPLSTARLNAYWQLMRADKPIGTYLLLWPTLWALWLAAEGLPQRHLLLIFCAGVFLMRSAGCVINDFADRHFDGHVKRTANRPLPSGKVKSGEALSLFLLLSLTAFVLVLFTNPLTIGLSFIAVVLAASYPFMKRFHHLPQVVLGAAFAWGIPMAFAAEQNQVPLLAWVIFAANLCWTVAYDTLYAMVDRDDDLNIGIKSSAILFGRHDLLIVGLLQLATLGLLAWAGELAGLGGWYAAALLGVAALFLQQQWQVRLRQREQCFQAFLANHWVGMLVFAGIVLDRWPAY
ncbi:4-hydroxybenzoate octaprenyltransferase [Balneatrix alpica]|uniref:4-hydroxybenzoate octaprenyltransferase n=1 Tax=Balneatrix alpica TaxID=75684 RepID=A0ABV5ZAP3_9GAMM|nr:4-hydroxybenzoate octaprenyltransferase [Balneatrix alpica]